MYLIIPFTHQLLTILYGRNFKLHMLTFKILGASSFRLFSLVIFYHILYILNSSPARLPTVPVSLLLHNRPPQTWWHETIAILLCSQFIESGIWNMHNQDSLSLFHNVWDLSWEYLKVGVWNHLKAPLFTTSGS